MAELTDRIDSYVQTIEDTPRNYISASSIGHDCLRRIWYEYKGYKGEAVSVRTRKIFEVGKALESFVIEWLKLSLGNICTVWYDLCDKELNYFKGHVDAVWVIDDEHIIFIEIKTANDASFNIFLKKGLRAWNYQYYCQLQSYMGMEGLNSAYILVLNKDNSEIWDELVTFDPVLYEQLKSKAKYIHDFESEPPRVNNSPLWFQCKQCKFRKECHG